METQTQTATTLDRRAAVSSGSISLGDTEYVIDDILGQGGMAIVYAAHSVKSNTKVALKTVLSPQAEFMAHLRGEIMALQALEHPQVVSILGYTDIDGVPCYAMDLQTGPTLKQWLAQRKHRASHQHSILTLFAQMCAPLAYIHSKGFVHQDLKPSNVFLDANRVPIIADFGVATQFAGNHGRERSSPLGIGGGSHGYMAPEQLSGAPVDARADLYAFGVMLLEALTGYSGAGTQQADRDRTLGELHTGAPRFLHLGRQIRRLLVHLLQPEPERRIGFASDVARLLREAGAALQTSALEGEAHNYLFRPPYCGRSVALSRLITWLTAAQHENAPLMLVGGESGVGKSRLVLEAVASAKKLGFQTICCEATPGPVVAERVAGALAHHNASSKMTLSLMFERMADSCQENPQSTLAELVEPSRGVLATLHPAFHPAQQKCPTDRRLGISTEFTGSDLASLLCDLLGALAADRPTFIVVDDLQWADEVALTLFEHIARRRAPLASNVAVLGSFRMDESSARLRSLIEAENCEFQLVEPLERESVEQMVSGMLGIDHAPPRLIEYIHQQTGGNPFFVSEYLRAATAEGLLERSSEGSWRWAEKVHRGEPQQVLPAPARQHATIQARIDALPDPERKLLEAAAVLGRVASTTALATMIDVNIQELWSRVRAMHWKQLLVTTPSGECKFTHDRLREHVYASIPARDRKELHRRAAETIDGSNDADAAAMALHHSQAGQLHRAYERFCEAAEISMTRYALNTAMQAYRNALTAAKSERQARGRSLDAEVTGGVDSPEDAWLSRERAATLHEALGDIALRLNLHNQAREDYRNAIGLQTNASHVHCARLRRKTAISLVWQGKLDAAEVELDKAASELESAFNHQEKPERWWNEYLEVQLELAESFYHRANEERIIGILNGLEAAVEQHATQPQRARIYRALSMAGFRSERYRLSAQTLAFAERAEAALADGGNASVSERLSIQFNTGFALLFSDEVDRAIAKFEPLIEDAERVGDQPFLTRTTNYLALAYRRSGNGAQARLWATRTLETALEGNATSYLGSAEANLAWCDFRSGHLHSAERRAHHALEYWSKDLSSAFPLKWTATLVLLAVVPADDREAQLGALQITLRADQAKLPPSVERELQAWYQALSSSVDRVDFAQRDRSLSACTREGLL